MTLDDFRQSLAAADPPADLTHALAGLWWDAKGDWKQAHESAPGRRLGGLVGARLPPPQGRRSGQRSLLVQPGWQARLPRTAGCGMAQHREKLAGVERPLASESGSGCKMYW
jgi:hypothetical protein